MNLIFFAIILFNIVYSKSKNQKIIKRKVFFKKDQKIDEHDSMKPTIIKRKKVSKKNKNIGKNYHLFRLLCLLSIIFIALNKISTNYWKKSPDLNSKSQFIDDLDDMGQKKYLFKILQSHIKKRYPNLKNKEIWFLVTNPDGSMADEIVFFEKEDKAPDGLCWLHSVNLSKDFEKLCHSKVTDIEISKFLIYYFTKNKKYIQQLPPNVQDVFNYIDYYKKIFENMPINSLTQDEKIYFLILKFLLDDMYKDSSNSIEEYIESKKINKEEISEYMEDINEISQEKDYFIKIKKIKTFFDKNKDKLKNNSFQLNCFPDEHFIKTLSSSIIKNRFWGDIEEICFFVHNLLDQPLIVINQKPYNCEFNSNCNFIFNLLVFMKRDFNCYQNQYKNEHDKIKFILEHLIKDKNSIISIFNGKNHYDTLIYHGSVKISELNISKKISLETIFNFWNI